MIGRGGAGKPAQDHHGHRRLNLAARLAHRKGKRDKRKPCGDRGHQDRNQPFLSGAPHRCFQISLALDVAQEFDVADQHHPVARGDAEQGDEADDRRYRQHAAGQPQSDNPADRSEAQVEQHDPRIAARPERPTRA